MPERNLPEPPIRTRQTDPIGYEDHARGQREINPTLWDWEAAYGKVAFRGRGIMLGVLVIAALLLASIWYLGLRQEATIKQALAAGADEHDQIVQSSQQTTCVLALAQLGRLEAFMKDYSSDAWSKWCWWVPRPKHERNRS